MPGYAAEFNTLIMVEQRLLNARGELQAAKRHVGDGTRLSDEMYPIAEALDDTITLARRAKHIMLKEWRRAEAGKIVA